MRITELEYISTETLYTILAGQKALLREVSATNPSKRSNREEEVVQEVASDVRQIEQILSDRAHVRVPVTNTGNEEVY